MSRIGSAVSRQQCCLADSGGPWTPWIRPWLGCINVRIIIMHCVRSTKQIFKISGEMWGGPGYHPCSYGLAIAVQHLPQWPRHTDKETHKPHWWTGHLFNCLSLFTKCSVCKLQYCNLCADGGDLWETDNGKLVTAHPRMPQLTPRFSKTSHAAKMDFFLPASLLKVRKLQPSPLSL